MMLVPRRTLHNPPLTLPAKRTTVLRPPFSIPVSASAPRRIRLCSQTRSSLLPDAFVSAPRYARISSQTRPHLPPDAFAHGTVFAIRHRGRIGRHWESLIKRAFPPSSLRLARMVYCQRFSERL